MGDYLHRNKPIERHGPQLPHWQQRGLNQLVTIRFAERMSQLPPYLSLYAEWDANPPEWLPDFVGLIRGQLGGAKAITNHLFGLSQFQIAKGSWDKFLTGEVDNPMTAMEEARDVVLAELARASS